MLYIIILQLIFLDCHVAPLLAMTRGNNSGLPRWLKPPRNDWSAMPYYVYGLRRSWCNE